MTQTNIDFKNDFAVFLLTNGRPDNVKTYDVLRKHGYTGKIFIIIDNMDKTANQYIENFGDQVIVFDKKEIAKTFDSADNFGEFKTITHARNATFEIAKSLGVEFFIHLDDDYTTFNYKYNEHLNFCSSVKIKSLDSVFKAMVEFLTCSKSIKTVAMSQEGDWVGGPNSGFAGNVKLRRKAMNSFVFETKNPITFLGTFNEDVNTYTSMGSRGNLFFTLNQIGLSQAVTQSNEGGITDLYLKYGTFVKAFYTVMHQPSSVKISKKLNRIHHHINWKNTVPMILRESIKKY